METIVILHGWGVTGNRYEAIQHIFEKKGYKVLAPDFPGFGKEPLQRENMFLDDYVSFLKKFLSKEKKVVLIGHSFGGRVAVKFTAQNPHVVKALIVTGAPVIKKRLSLRKQMIQFLVKTFKKTVPKFLEEVVRKNTYRMLGEWDYYKAGILKQTLRNVLAEDISPYLSKIKVPTLVIWGEKDTFVSVSIGREIAGKIQGAQLELIKDATHKLPYEAPSLFAEKVIAFLQSAL